MCSFVDEDHHSTCFTAVLSAIVWALTWSAQILSLVLVHVDCLSLTFTAGGNWAYSNDPSLSMCTLISFAVAAVE